MWREHAFLITGEMKLLLGVRLIEYTFKTFNFRRTKCTIKIYREISNME